jgi:hypothetical protein
MTISRLASLLVAFGYLIAAFIGAKEGKGGLAVLLTAVILLFPLALIWFSDVFGDYIGSARRGYIDQKTPSVIITVAGWFFLVGLPLIVYQISRSRG